MTPSRHTPAGLPGPSGRCPTTPDPVGGGATVDTGVVVAVVGVEVVVPNEVDVAAEVDGAVEVELAADVDVALELGDAVELDSGAPLDVVATAVVSVLDDAPRTVAVSPSRTDDGGRLTCRSWVGPPGAVTAGPPAAISPSGAAVRSAGTSMASSSGGLQPEAATDTTADESNPATITPADRTLDFNMLPSSTR